MSGWAQDRQSAAIMRSALDELRAEVAAQKEATASALQDLKASIDAERRAYQAQVKRARGNGLLWGLLVGAGVAVVVQ